MRFLAAILIMAMAVSLVAAAFMPKEATAQTWPTSWIWIDDDANENGPQDDYRDARAAYFNFDSQDVYFRVQLYAAPTFAQPVRFKYLIDTGVGQNLYQPDGSIRGSEYILFVEDANPDDGTGEVYLVSANGDDTYQAYEPTAYRTNPGPVTDSTVAGYRFVTVGGNYYVDMYVSFSALGVSSIYDISFWWASDQENPNLEQGPSTDAADEADAPFNGGSYTIVKTVTDVGGQGPTGTVDAAGDVITYRVVVTNTGITALTGISLVDSLVFLLGSPVESMASDGILEPRDEEADDYGETWTWTYTYTATQADIDGNGGGDGDIDDIATVYSNELGPLQDAEDVPTTGGGGGGGGVRRAPASPSIYAGIAAATGAGVLAYLFRKKVAT